VGGRIGTDGQAPVTRLVGGRAVEKLATPRNNYAVADSNYTRLYYGPPKDGVHGHPLPRRETRQTSVSLILWLSVSN